MEPEGSSPHSQAPATCPYPEPAHSSPHTHIPPGFSTLTNKIHEVKYKYVSHKTHFMFSADSYMFRHQGAIWGSNNNKGS
jgi:hypothetical protein